MWNFVQTTVKKDVEYIKGSVHKPKSLPWMPET